MPITLAETKTEPELACGEKSPNYILLEIEWDDVKIKNKSAYDNAFEAAQEAHHNYVGCIFEFAEKEILKSGATKQGGEEAYSHSNDLLDWMAPDQACLTPTELKKLIQNTDPSQMLKPILEAHAKYKSHLNSLGTSFASEIKTTNMNGRVLTGIKAVVEMDSAIGEAKRQRELEIISSLAAIDMAFASLKELRLSIVMHVHFQCTLKYLEKYRTALENLRSVIDILPGELRDASVTK